MHVQACVCIWVFPSSVQWESIEAWHHSGNERWYSGLEYNYHSLIKGIRIPCKSGWFRDLGRENTRWDCTWASYNDRKWGSVFKNGAC